MNTDWFIDALTRVGSTQAGLARHLGLPPSAVSRMLRGERQMKLLEAVQTAQFLDVSQEEVLRQAADEGIPATPRRRGRPPGAATGAPQRDTNLIPIRDARGEPVGVTPCPANLTGVRDAYAVYVEDQSLMPRYEPGWLLHVHPFKPPARGRDVVVRRQDGSTLLRQFVGWDGDSLILRQLTPEETQRLPRGEVESCHLIVGVDQEG